MAADRSLYIEVVLDDRGIVRKLGLADDALARTKRKAEDAGAGMDALERAMTRANAVGGIIANTVMSLARGAFGFLTSTIANSIQVSSQYSNTFIGLSTVAKAYGQDATKTKEAAQELAKDGLMGVAQAAAGLKNLLASGFGLPEATNLMKGFKDIAAFNRQASYEFGYAIVTATEGIKNQNSILVDNAGLTKNLSVIIREAGLQMTDLARVSTNAGVRAKFYNGLMKEMAFSQGDAAKLTQTYSGAVSKLSTAWTNAQAIIGDSVTQNQTLATAIGMVADAIVDMNSGLSKNDLGLKLVSGSIIFVVKSASALVGALQWVTTGFYRVRQAVYEGIEGVAKWALETNKSIMGVLQTLASIPGSDFFSNGTLKQSMAMLQEQIDVAGSLAHNFGEEAKKAGADGKWWADTLQPLQDRLNKTAGELEKTYGQAIKVAEGAQTGAKKTAELGEAAKKTAAEYAKFGKSLADISAELQRMRADGVATATILDQLGGKIEKAMEEAAAFPKQKISKDILEVARLLDTLARIKVNKEDAAKEVERLSDSLQQWLLSRPLKLLLQPTLEGVGAGTAVGSTTWASILEPLKKGVESQLGKPTFWESATKGFGTAMKDGLGPAILAAFQGGGDAGKSIGGFLGGTLSASLGATLKKSIGGTLGSVVGSIVPGLGTLLGGLAGGGLGSLFGKLFGGGEGKKVNDLRDAMFAAAGGTNELDKQAKAAGVTLDRVFRAKTVKDYEAAVKDLQTALDENAQTLARAEAAAEKYGLTTGELGAKWKQTRTDAGFKEWLLDLQALKAQGADMDAVFTKMGPSMALMVKQAIEAGATVPRELEPFLKKMMEMGTLSTTNTEQLNEATKEAERLQGELAAAMQDTSAEGVAKQEALKKAIEEANQKAKDATTSFTDMKEVPFAETLSQGFDRVIAKLQTLINTIRGIPDEFTDAANAAASFGDTAQNALEGARDSAAHLVLGRSPGLIHIPKTLQDAAKKAQEFLVASKGAMETARYYVANLTADQRALALALVDSGTKVEDIAKAYGSTPQIVQAIIDGLRSAAQQAEQSAATAADMEKNLLRDLRLSGAASDVDRRRLQNDFSREDEIARVEAMRADIGDDRANRLIALINQKYDRLLADIEQATSGSGSIASGGDRLSALVSALDPYRAAGAYYQQTVGAAAAGMLGVTFEDGAINFDSSLTESELTRRISDAIIRKLRAAGIRLG